MRYGNALLDPGRRKNELESILDRVFGERFKDRVLPFDRAAAYVFGDIVARRESLGLVAEYPDMQIAAIALSRGAIVATRNISDYEQCGLQLINPWNATP